MGRSMSVVVIVRTALTGTFGGLDGSVSRTPATAPPARITATGPDDREESLSMPARLRAGLGLRGGAQRGDRSLDGQLAVAALVSTSSSFRSPTPPLAMGSPATMPPALPPAMGSPARGWALAAPATTPGVVADGRADPGVPVAAGGSHGSDRSTAGSGQAPGGVRVVRAVGDDLGRGPVGSRSCGGGVDVGDVRAAGEGEGVDAAAPRSRKCPIPAEAASAGGSVVRPPTVDGGRSWPACRQARQWFAAAR